jgi:hypothetical protein
MRFPPGGLKLSFPDHDVEAIYLRGKAGGKFERNSSSRQVTSTFLTSTLASSSLFFNQLQDGYSLSQLYSTFFNLVTGRIFFLNSNF